jgi:hypothetical protein
MVPMAKEYIQQKLNMYLKVDSLTTRYTIKIN